MADVEVAVVTGGARGLGLAIATALAKRGARVCLLDLSRQALVTAAERLAAAVPAAQVMVHAVDVSDANGVAAAVAAVSRRWGRVDTLVQAAGAPSSTLRHAGRPDAPTACTMTTACTPRHTPSCALARDHGQDEHQDGGGRAGRLRQRAPRLPITLTLTLTLTLTRTRTLTLTLNLSPTPTPTL